MKSIHILILSILAAVAFSCTDYQEENVPQGMTVDASELSFGYAEDLNRTVKVRSGSKWSVGEMPDWLKVQSIDAASAAFEWNVNFIASQNDGYDREGTVTLTSGAETASVSLSQKGRRGTYVAVESLSISPESLTLKEGESFKLTVSISPENASEKDVKWSNTDPTVATVDNHGMVTAKKMGNVTITVITNDGGKTATCNVTVEAAVVPVTSVSLDKTSLTMTEGDTQTLIATVKPDNATDKSVTWSSSNSEVATVSSSGEVAAKKAGNATITVKTNDGGKTATCSVTVKAATVPVTGVSLDMTSLTMTEGETQTLTATLSPSNATDKSVIWSSNNTSVATVSSSGVVTAIKAGSATITVKTNDGGKTATCSLTVTALSSGQEAVDLGLPSGLKWGSCNIGASKPEEYGDYYAWGETETKPDYSWSTYKWCNGSSNSLTKYNTDNSYGTVDNKTGLENSDDVAHVKLGGKWRMPTDDEWTELRTKCTWTWTTVNGVYGRKVTGPNGNSIFLPAAGYRSHTILSSASSYGHYWSSSLSTFAPSYAWGVNFYSDDVERSYFSVRFDGWSVRPVYVGNTVSVSSVSLNVTNMTMTEGEMHTLTATVKPDNATDKSVTWSSNNTSVATVSSSGVVTAIKAGSATITVKTNDGGKTATCAVTVTASSGQEAVDLGLPSGLKWGSCNIGASKPEEYGDYYAWGETETKPDYSWSTYKWCNGSSNSLTKYNTDNSYGTVDNKTRLENSDDVAHVKLGGKWRMPTDGEWTELRTKCTWTWTTVNGVYGRKVTGPNGNSIFLPAAGYRDGTSLYSAGSGGYYWSSSLYTGYPDIACYVVFGSEGVKRSYYDRFYGRSVRPVSN